MTALGDMRAVVRRRLGHLRVVLGRFRLYRLDLGVLEATRLAFGDRRGRIGDIEVRYADYPAPFRLRAGGSDVLTFHQVIVRKGYEFPVSLPAEPGIVIDAGANIGMSAIWFAHRYPGAKVIAVEPEPENFEQLQRNTAPYPAIVPVQAAVWPHSAPLTVVDGHGGSFAFRVQESDPEASGATLRAISIGDILEEFDLPFVDVLKVDIEGSEKELFEGDTSWLERVGAVTIELHDRFRTGCRSAFDAATGDFTERRTIHDETFVTRPSSVSSGAGPTAPTTNR